MKRMLDVLRPQIELQFKSWGSCLPDGGHVTPGERISEITVMLRTKFRGYMQAVMDKLVENVGILLECISLVLFSFSLKFFFVVCKSCEDLINSGFL